MPLGSGDFEAVSYGGRQSARGGSFPQPSGRGYNQTGPFPQQGGYSHPPHPSTRASARSVPPAPHSLAPVAMASARNAVSTGPQPVMSDPGTARPSAKAGMSILFAGAIIGGLIGAVMHARQNAADAFAAAAEASSHVAHDDNAGKLPPLPGLDSSAKPADSAKIPDINAKVDASKDTKTDTTAKDDKKKKPKFAWSGPRPAGGGVVKTTTASADVSGGDTPAPATDKKAKKGASDDDGWTVASADGAGSGAGTTTKPVADKPAPEPKADKKKPAAVADKGDKAEAPPPAKKPSGKSDDAVNVLKAAMGATENTL
jgi:hypothetical protein